MVEHNTTKVWCVLFEITTSHRTRLHYHVPSPTQLLVKTNINKFNSLSPCTCNIASQYASSEYELRTCKPTAAGNNITNMAVNFHEVYFIPLSGQSNVYGLATLKTKDMNRVVVSHVRGEKSPQCVEFQRGALRPTSNSVNFSYIPSKEHHSFWTPHPAVLSRSRQVMQRLYRWIL